MQLTANFVLLATVLAYGSSSVLALPLGSTFAAGEVEAREFQDELSYFAREVPESMYLDARSFFSDDYEDVNARADASDPVPVSAAVATPVTPASATPETPVTANPTDVNGTNQKALPGTPDSEGPHDTLKNTKGEAASAEHPPVTPASATPETPVTANPTDVNGTKQKALPGTPDSEGPHDSLKNTKGEAASADHPPQRKITGASKSKNQKGQGVRGIHRPLTMAARLRKERKARTLSAERERQAQRQRWAERKLRTQGANGAEKATAESATTPADGSVKKPLADEVPVSAKGPTDSASATPPANEAEAPVQPPSAVSGPAASGLQ